MVNSPEVKDISTLDFKAEMVDSIMEHGEIAVREQMSKIKELIAAQNIKRNNTKKYKV